MLRVTGEYLRAAVQAEVGRLIAAQRRGQGEAREGRSSERLQIGDQVKLSKPVSVKHFQAGNMTITGEIADTREGGYNGRNFQIKFDDGRTGWYARNEFRGYRGPRKKTFQETEHGAIEGLDRIGEARFSIMYQYRSSDEPEEVDTANTENEARKLLAEYKMAFRQGKVWVESGFGKKVMEAEGLSKRQRQLLDLVKGAGPGGYEVGGFGHPDASALYRAGLVEMGKSKRGVTVLKITPKGQSA